MANSSNEYKAGTLHWLKVVYEDDPDAAKIRPVLILDIVDDVIYYFPITSQPGKPHQKKYRSPLNDWKLEGLSQPSYINIKIPPSQAYKSDFIEPSYIGLLTQNDMNCLDEYMIKLGY